MVAGVGLGETGTNTLVDFLPMNIDLLGCLYADAYLVALYLDNRYLNVVADHQCLARMA